MVTAAKAVEAWSQEGYVVEPGMSCALWVLTKPLGVPVLSFPDLVAGGARVRRRLGPGSAREMWGRAVGR